MTGVGGEILQKAQEAALDVLAIAPAVPRTRDESLAFLSRTRAAIETLELAHAQVAANLTAIDIEEGCLGGYTPGQWLRSEVKVSSSVASASLTVGEQWELLPQSRQAVLERRIGFAHLNHIARTAEFVGDGFDETELLGKAERTDKSASSTRLTSWS